jgi:hypothetical protein
MSGLRFVIEFLFYLLTCLIAVVSFVYINYVFARKSFYGIIQILMFYALYLLMLLLMFFLPRFYISVIACFPSSVWASDHAAISLVFWALLVLPCFVILNITLFIILIVKILGPKKELQPKSASADAPSE